MPTDSDELADEAWLEKVGLADFDPVEYLAAKMAEELERVENGGERTLLATRGQVRAFFELLGGKPPG